MQAPSQMTSSLFPLWAKCSHPGRTEHVLSRPLFFFPFLSPSRDDRHDPGRHPQGAGEEHHLSCLFIDHGLFVRVIIRRTIRSSGARTTPFFPPPARRNA